MKEVELVVIGGGAAGMAAAVSAYKNGVRDILILERNSALGESCSSAFITDSACTALRRI